MKKLKEFTLLCRGNTRVVTDRAFQPGSFLIIHPVVLSAVTKTFYSRGYNISMPCGYRVAGIFSKKKCIELVKELEKRVPLKAFQKANELKDARGFGRFEDVVRTIGALGIT